jgi:hypothetical protein
MVDFDWEGSAVKSLDARGQRILQLVAPKGDDNSRSIPLPFSEGTDRRECVHFGLSDNAPNPFVNTISTNIGAADTLTGSTQVAT